MSIPQSLKLEFLKAASGIAEKATASTTLPENLAKIIEVTYNKMKELMEKE